MRWLLLVVLIPGFAFSQTDDRRARESEAFNKSESIKNASTDTYQREGNFGWTPILELTNLGYDSNVLYLEDDEESDLTAFPRLGITSWFVPNRDWVWKNEAAYRYRYYQDFDSLRISEYDIQSTLYGMMEKAYFQFDVRFQDDQGQQNSELTANLSSQTTTISGEGVFQVVPRGHLTTEVEFRDIEFSEDRVDIGQQLNRDETRFRVGYIHKVQPRFWPYIAVEQTDYSFVETGNPRDDSSVQGAVVGFRNEKGERTHYKVEVGSYDLSYDLAPAADDTVVNYDALLEYRLDRRALLRVGSFSRPIFSFRQDFGNFITTRYYAVYNWRMDRGRSWTVTLLSGTNDYETTFSGSDEQTSDDYQRLSVSYQFPAFRFLDVTVRALVDERDSDEVDLGFERNMLTANLKYRFK